MTKRGIILLVLLVNVLQVFGYTYQYDNLNRLKTASAHMNGGGYSYYSANYAYDKNGNMTSLFRQENYGGVVLSLAHSGNQLSQAVDLIAADTDDYYYYSYDIHESNFENYAHSDTVHYGYNRNGAMVRDPYKGAQYSYNALGMPLQVQVPSILGRIDYTYSATGEKLSAYYRWHSGLSIDPLENVGKPTYTMQNSTKTRAYASNKIYENSALKKIFVSHN